MTTSARCETIEEGTENENDTLVMLLDAYVYIFSQVPKAAGNLAGARWMQHNYHTVTGAVWWNHSISHASSGAQIRCHSSAYLKLMSGKLSLTCTRLVVPFPL